MARSFEIRASFSFLDLGLRDHGVMDEKERLRKYRQFVYETGAVDMEKGASMDKKIVEKE